jgi:hypothetical protein
MVWIASSSAGGPRASTPDAATDGARSATTRYQVARVRLDAAAVDPHTPHEIARPAVIITGRFTRQRDVLLLLLGIYPVEDFIQQHRSTLVRLLMAEP